MSQPPFGVQFTVTAPEFREKILYKLEWRLQEATQRALE